MTAFIKFNALSYLVENESLDEIENKNGFKNIINERQQTCQYMIVTMVFQCYEYVL